MKLLKRAFVVVVVALALLAAAAVGAVIWRVTLQKAVARERVIHSSNGIDVMETVQIGGIPQVLRIRGESLDNPVLLFVHGGPGTPMIPFAHTFEGLWEHQFTVVQWDQRGAGKTAALSDPATIAAGMSVDVMKSDLVEVTNYLRTRFHKDKIVLLGHSWGSILSIPVALEHPELYSAYVGTGQVIDVVRAERLGYEHTLLEAEKMGITDAIRELKAIAPYPPPGVWHGEKLDTRHKWNAYFGESVFGYQDLADAMAKFAWESPDYTLHDFIRLMGDTESIYEHLNEFIYNFDARQFGLEWRIPVFIINGRYDYQINNDVAYQYFEAIHAPLKRFYYIEKASHAAMVEQPRDFARILIDDVRPFAITGDGPTPPPQ